MLIVKLTLIRMGIFKLLLSHFFNNYMCEIKNSVETNILSSSVFLPKAVCVMKSI